MVCNIQDWTDSIGVGLNESPDHWVGVVGQAVSGEVGQPKIKENELLKLHAQAMSFAACSQD